MDKLLPFLKARLAERSSRIQLVVLVLLGAVSAGFLTMAQIQSWGAYAMGLVATIGPLVGVLFPDKNHDVVSAAAVDDAVNAALAVATAAAEEKAGVKATDLARTVGGIADKLGL
jgi:hypothetical protein